MMNQNLLATLVGGFNPFEKYASKWESSPNRGENKKCLKPPTVAPLKKKTLYTSSHFDVSMLHSLGGFCKISNKMFLQPCLMKHQGPFRSIGWIWDPSVGYIRKLPEKIHQGPKTFTIWPRHAFGQISTLEEKKVMFPFLKLQNVSVNEKPLKAMPTCKVKEGPMPKP